MSVVLTVILKKYRKSYFWPMLMNGNVSVSLYPVPLCPACDYSQKRNYLFNGCFKGTLSPKKYLTN